MQKTILVVDDQPGVRRMLQQILNRAGHQVIEAEDEPTAWAAVRRHGAPCNLAIIDIDLPGLGGPEVASNIRMFGDMPVLFMTGLDPDVLMTEGWL